MKLPKGKKVVVSTKVEKEWSFLYNKTKGRAFLFLFFPTRRKETEKIIKENLFQIWELCWQVSLYIT